MTEYESLSLKDLCAHLRRADAALELVGDRAAEALKGAPGTWPVNDFGPYARLYWSNALGAPIEPGEHRLLQCTFPTDKTVLVVAVKLPGTWLSVYNPPENLKFVAEAADEVTKLWLPVEPREPLQMTFRNKSGEIPVSLEGLQILAYILEGKRI